MRKKKQIHFELPPDLYGKWKSFFRNLPRGTETKTLITLIIQFLEAEYDNGEIGVDFKSNRKG